MKTALLVAALMLASLRASNRLTLTWRITLRWPEEIAPMRQVK
jgi:hypothetical protein